MAARTLRIGRRVVNLSNPEKDMYPAVHFRKEDVMRYYLSVAPVLLPHLRNRALTLKRYPEGVEDEHFYEKDAPGHKPSWVKTFDVERKEGGEQINFVMVNDRATLAWCVNLACLEMHPLLSRCPNMQIPSCMVFDLDPGEGADVVQCSEVAFYLKELFDGLRLKSFVKVSGSKGIQVYVPLNGRLGYQVTRPFAQAVAELMAIMHPDLVVARMAKRLRGGKVLIDWSQNDDHKSTVAVYSLRAKRELPFVSFPFTWQQLGRLQRRGDPAAFDISPDEAVERIVRQGDIFGGVLSLRQTLDKKYLETLAPPKGIRRPGARKVKTPLDRYNVKRDFSKTPEPAGNKHARRAAGSGFTVQKHQARHLHFDFRLEMRGVLRSWAVPKGPPLQRGERRLAMLVEDHPLDYGAFEGVIPPGNYGAGTVMLWDRGTYTEQNGDPAAAFEKGKLHIVLDGQKLKGEWALVKLSGEDNRWFLIKVAASLAVPASSAERSVLSGRTMEQIAADQFSEKWESLR